MVQFSSMARDDEAGTYLTEFVYHKAEVPEVWLKSTHLRVQKVLRIDLDCIMTYP